MRVDEIGPTHAQQPAGFSDRLLRWTVFIAIAYWALFALVTPVTVWDSHTYNLARLPIAALDGLFGNSLFVNERQIAMPWSFDAVHLPFLSLGWGYAIPSYLCLLGIAWMVFQMLRQTSGPRTAMVAVLALFSLPTVIYQATSTKNDLAVVFVALFAFYSMFRFRRQRNQPAWLFLSAIAIGFLPGIKGTGLAFGLLLSLYTVFRLRGEHRLLSNWAIATGLSFCLFGSLETYVNNLDLYGNPLGSSDLIAFVANRDGIAGGAANLIRYVFSFINLGSPLYPIEAPWKLGLEDTCRDLLAALHLADTGYQSPYSDQSLRFLKTGGEAGSDYGPLGTAAMAVAAAQVLMFRRRQPAFWVAMAGWLVLLVTAATVGWMPWNLRFLMLPAILFVVATLMSLDRHIEGKNWVVMGIWSLLMFGVIAYPLSSYNKRPHDLLDAIQHREAQSLRERPAMQNVYASVRGMQESSPGAPWLLHADVDSWVLGLMLMPAPAFTPAPVLDGSILARAERISHSGTVLVLALNRSIPAAPDLNLVRVAQIFGEANSAIYQWWPEHRVRSVAATGFRIARSELTLSVGDQHIRATRNGGPFRTGLFMLALDTDGRISEAVFSHDFADLLVRYEGRYVIGISVHEPGGERRDEYFHGRMTSDARTLQVRPLNSDVVIPAADVGF